MRKIALVLVSLIVILSVIMGTGCSLIVSSTTGNSDNSSQTVEPVVETVPRNGNNSEITIPVCEHQPALPSIADVVAEVKPSVVIINTEVAGYDYFYRPTTQQATGSGFIITEDGYIVTNNHVIEGAQSITVILDDKRSFDAEVIGTDPYTDMAVIKIDANNLLTVKMGDSSIMRIGDWVVAIGNSLGEGTSATNGIISAKNASLSFSAEQTLYNLLRTNAEINQGNSGGPLVNMSGEVIGITSAKVASVGVEGMNYAISTETATPIIEQLINQGFASHPWLGVSLYTVDEYVIERFILAVDKGAFLTEVVPDSPASEAGLETYDVIVNFNGQTIESVDDLIEAIQKTRVGQEVDVKYWHGSQELTTSLTLGERPTEQ